MLTDTSITRLHALLALSSSRDVHRALRMAPSASRASMDFPFSKNFVFPHPKAGPNRHPSKTL